MKTESKNALVGLVSLISIFAVTGCASAPLPKEKREITFVEETKVSRDDAFQRARTHLAKTLGNSNAAFRVNDDKNATLITRIILDCKDWGCGGLSMSCHYQASYNLEINAKENKVRFTYEPYEVSKIGWNGQPMSPSAITEPDQVVNAKTCAQINKSEIMTEIGGPAAHSDKW